MKTDINTILFRVQRMENTGDLFAAVQDIADYLALREREIDDTLRNLDSDNIAEIDFGRTRIKNFKG